MQLAYGSAAVTGIAATDNFYLDAGKTVGLTAFSFMLI